MARRKAEHSHLLNAKIDTYSSHVLDKLVGIKGRDRSDVAAFMIRDWIGAHQQEIAGYGIRVSVKDAELVIE